MRKTICYLLGVLFMAACSIQIAGLMVLVSVIPWVDQGIIALFFLGFAALLHQLVHRVANLRWPPWREILALSLGGTALAWVLQVAEFGLYTWRSDISWTFNPFEDELRRSLLLVLPAMIFGGIVGQFPPRISIACFAALTVAGAFWVASGFEKKMPIVHPPLGRSGPDRPNIVLVLLDDVGYGDLPVYGNKQLATPHMDAMAREGVRFTSAYATAPVCAPSRASLLTGKYSQRYGMEGLPDPFPFIFRYRRANFKGAPNGDYPEPEVPWWELTPLSKRGLPSSQPGIASRLKGQGYATALFGKWHGGAHPNFSPLRHGFDTFVGFKAAGSLYADRKDTSIVTRPPTNSRIDQITNQLYNYFLFENDRLRLRAPRIYQTDLFTEKALTFVDQQRDHPFFLFLSYSAAHAPLQAKKSHFRQLASIQDLDMRTFYAMLLAVDEGLGRIRARLDELDLTRNTLFVITSDNGAATYLEIPSVGKLRGGKFSHFEGGIRVPLLMSWPGRIPGGSVYSRPVSHLDILPTLAGVSGTPLDPDETDGVDLLPFLRDTTLGEAPHRVLYFRNRYSKAIRSGDLKLYVNDKNRVSYLFNLADDPGELHDLSREMPAEKQQLTRQLATWEKGLQPPRWQHAVNFAIWGGDQYYYFGE